MSDLQIGLLAIGAVVVIAVLAYNKWQEIKYRRETETALQSPHGDVLMGSAAEPASITEPLSPQRERAERIEPTFEDAGPGANPGGDAEAIAVPGSSRETSLSDDIDFIVAIEAGEDIDGEALLEAAEAPLAGFPKAVVLEGFDPAQANWGPLQPGTRYALMRAGMQLVDRRGPATEEELADFGAAVQQAAAAAGALATVPDCREAVARAGELDQFCGEVDILIEMHIIPATAPFPGTKVRALAEANGFVLEGDGRFRRRDEAARVLCELANMGAAPFVAESMRTMSVAGITLELDVPRTPEPVRAFDQLRELMRQFAQTLDGSVVDEKRAAISTAALDQIRARIQTVQRAMIVRSIAPGSGPALRLFS